MPRNRQATDRDVRVDEMLDAAQDRFLQLGYAHTSMADIARHAGVAPGAVYWYFPSKEHAFSAVLNRMIDQGIERIRARIPQDAEPMESLFMALSEVHRYGGFQSTVHDLALRSEVVAEVHRRFHSELDAFVEAALHARMAPGPDRDLAKEAVTATLDGALAHERPDGHIRELLGFVIDRVTRVESPTCRALSR